MASRSRWLVGSSSRRRLVPRATSTARPARERSPGDSAASGLRRCSAPRSNLASRDRACSTDSSVRSVPRPAGCPPGALPGRGGRRPPRPEPDGALRRQLAGQRPSGVDLPAPFGPVGRSRQCSSRSTGPAGSRPAARSPRPGWPRPRRCGGRPGATDAVPAPRASRGRRGAQAPPIALAWWRRRWPAPAPRPGPSLSVRRSPRRLAAHSRFWRAASSSRDRSALASS